MYPSDRSFCRNVYSAFLTPLWGLVLYHLATQGLRPFDRLRALFLRCFAVGGET